MLKTMTRRALRAFAPFACVDSFGTDQRAYTLTGAAEWLPSAEAVNADATVQALAVKNGHNAPQMLARMLREAKQLHAEALAGGARRG